MFINTARHRSIAIFHLHMGGPDAVALEWKSLLSPRFAPRLQQMGAALVSSGSPRDADVVVVTGLLTLRNLDEVLYQLSLMPSPSVIIAAGDSAINGRPWAQLDMPALDAYNLGHYADVQITVPGDPPTPQALLASLVAAAERLSQPGERLADWQDD